MPNQPKQAEPKRYRGQRGQNAEGRSTLYEEQRRRTAAQAEREELRNQVMRGELIEREAVEKEWFRIGRQIRDSMNNLPLRLAAVLAVEREQDKIFAILNKELQQCLEGLSQAKAEPWT